MAGSIAIERPSRGLLERLDTQRDMSFLLVALESRPIVRSERNAQFAPGPLCRAAKRALLT
jgi:hypothetical protein